MITVSGEKGRTLGMEEQMEMDLITERYELAKDRITQIAAEVKESDLFEAADYRNYFCSGASYAAGMCEMYDRIKAGSIRTEKIETLQKWNHEMYAELMPEQYEQSFCNPTYAAARLGADLGKLLCVLAAELRSLIGSAYEQELEFMTIYMELFIEVYHCFEDEWTEIGKLPSAETIREMIYWFASDYAEVVSEKRVRKLVDPKNCFAADIVMNSDLSDLRYLYAYGEYISENELRMAAYMNTLPEEKVKLMADTFTEGYRIGFEVTGKDLSKKGTVAISYHIGFERMIRIAMENFAKMGLQTVIYRKPLSFLEGKAATNRQGFDGGNANRQFDYDHKDDQALVLDKAYMNRRMEVQRAAFELYKKEAGLFAGPAVLEVFGETPFEPVTKKEACALSGEQRHLVVEMRSGMMNIQMQYIKEEERSFTIIAFPVPEIGEQFEEIFDEIIRINTLDYKLYQGLQQNIIDVLDQADYVQLKGMNGNRTDLKVKLYELKDPAKETVFENCVADVNIPVGEVFTSPVLAGTNGVLHVSRVFLNGLEYKDLAVTFKDGMVADYSCANFAQEEENRNFIKENLLFNHDTLPLGEFAVGTNTTAYVAAQKYDIGALLPILIAEKTGPHFAVGDTCYSHEEELCTYNPDGKQIVARENEVVAAYRKTDPSKAYFNCHTDITIPYDELGELAAVKKDGSSTVIIRDGRFVLPGCEELNKPFED